MKKNHRLHRILCMALTLCMVLGTCLHTAGASGDITITLSMPEALYYGVPTDIPYQITGGTGDIVDAYYYFGAVSGSAGSYSADFELPAAREGVISGFTPKADSITLFLYATDSTGAQGRCSSGHIQVIPEDDPSHPGIPGAPDPITITAEVPDTIIETMPFEVSYQITGGTGDIVDVYYYYFKHFTHITAMSNTAILPAGRAGTFTCTLPAEATNGYDFELHLFATDSAGTTAQYISDRIKVWDADDPTLPDEREGQYAAVYDFDFYAARYPDVVSAIGSDRTGVLDYFLSRGMAEGHVACAAFDVSIYRANYADLNSAFGDELPLYYQHYISSGAAEGRVANTLISSAPVEPEQSADERESAYAAVYSYDSYLNMYADISAAFNGDRTAAIDHFINHGMSEGRQGNSSFIVEYYRTNYADLQNAFGSDLKAYYMHYISNGKAEGRVANQLLTAETPEQPAEPEQPDVSSREHYYAPVYDFDYYIGRYPDIAAAFNGDRAATLDHFISHGMDEGRQGNAEFSVNIYRARYADLEAAFGGDLHDYYKHYINHGKAEGRSAR